MVGKQIPAYSLSVPWRPLGAALWALSQTALQEKQRFLWTTSNSPEELEGMKALVSLRLTSISPTLELRSVRRGGLQAMAARGEKMETILLFSQHKNIDMLRRYLNWGACSLVESTLMVNCVNRGLH